jgi:hypothetical protein
MSATDTQNTTAPGTTEGQAAGSPSQADTSTSGERTETAEETVSSQDEGSRELRRKLTEQAETLKTYERLFDRIEGDPELAQIVKAKLSGTPMATAQKSKIAKMIEDNFEGGPAETMKALLDEVIAQAKAEAVGALDPRLKELNRDVGMSRFERALRANGLTPDVIESREFLDHVDEMRKKNYVRALETHDQAALAEVVVNSWKTGQGAKSTFRNERARVEDAKTSRLNTHTPRGSGSPGRVKAKNTLEYLKFLDQGLTKEQIDLA